MSGTSFKFHRHITLTRTDHNPQSLPLGSEILKLAIALAYVRLEKDTSNNKRPRKSSSHVSLPNAHLKQQSPLEVTYHSIVYLLPSLLYFMKNTSDTISLQHLQPPTFQVYSNLKIGEKHVVFAF